MNDDEKKRLEAKKRRDEELQDLRFVLGDSRGIRVLRRLVEFSGMYRLSYTGENTHQTAFNEGQRNVGQFIQSEVIDAASDKWLEIMKGK